MPNHRPKSRQAPLQEIVAKMQEDEDASTATVGKLVKLFKRRGFGPLLLIPALVLFLPTGAIPGAPIICSILMMFVTVQIILGYESPWLPKRLEQITFDNQKLQYGLRKITPAVRAIDRYTSRRITWLITPISKRAIALLCLLLSVAIIPIGLVPFAVDPIALAIIFFALGFCVDDGLLIGVGLLVAAGGLVGLWLWWG